MTRLHVCLAALCALGLVTPRAALAATFDLTGTWSYTTSNNWVTGVCPKGMDSSGTLQISQTGDSFTLQLLSGMVCDPASMCSYSGTIAGAVYTATNSAVVDTEGGKATNTITFTATSTTAASGADSSTYVHPGGMTCTWGFDITLTRTAPPDGGIGKDGGGVLPGVDAAPATDGGAPPDDTGIGTDTGSPEKTDDGGGCAVDGRPPADLALALPLLLLWLRRRRGA